jgi:hypothetical protein
MKRRVRLFSAPHAARQQSSKAKKQAQQEERAQTPTLAPHEERKKNPHKTEVRSRT